MGCMDELPLEVFHLTADDVEGVEILDSNEK